MSAEIAEARATVGAMFLDQVVPGWADIVSPDTLALDTACDCVLGQLYGTYHDGLRTLALDGEDEAARLGFTADGRGPTRAGFGELAVVWRELIMARRAGQHAA